MRRLLTVTLIAALSAAASPGGVAQRRNPKLKAPPKKVGIALPDLVVDDLGVIRGNTYNYRKVQVTVKNTCAGPAGASYVLIKFMDKAGAGGKVFHFVGHDVGPLKGGESQTLVIEAGDKGVPDGTHIYAEVDPYDKVEEDVENNNWRKMNPTVAPFPENGSTHCKSQK